MENNIRTKLIKLEWLASKADDLISRTKELKEELEEAQKTEESDRTWREDCTLKENPPMIAAYQELIDQLNTFASKL